ncbi:transcription factor kayak-like [Drosophila elegans]|uniref:transcription factor kayak-like n=1 Tax=Drosophila elegans TaxID=30023 RepID=UPI001BC84772|nr:transcription factor kayak-like [Drosophila elegans]
MRLWGVWAAAKSINHTDSPTTDKLVTHTNPNRRTQEPEHPMATLTHALDCIGGPKLVTRFYIGDNMLPQEQREPKDQKDQNQQNEQKEQQHPDRDCHCLPESKMFLHLKTKPEIRTRTHSFHLVSEVGGNGGVGVGVGVVLSTTGYGLNASNMANMPNMVATERGGSGKRQQQQQKQQQQQQRQQQRQRAGNCIFIKCSS